jgi:hypothetical protein
MHYLTTTLSATKEKAKGKEKSKENKDKEKKKRRKREEKEKKEKKKVLHIQCIISQFRCCSCIFHTVTNAKFILFIPVMMQGWQVMLRE